MKTKDVLNKVIDDNVDSVHEGGYILDRDRFAAQLKQDMLDMAGKIIGEDEGLIKEMHPDFDFEMTNWAKSVEAAYRNKLRKEQDKKARKIINEYFEGSIE